MVGQSTRRGETTLRHTWSLEDKSCATIETIWRKFLFVDGTELGNKFVSAWNRDKTFAPGLVSIGDNICQPLRDLSPDETTLNVVAKISAPWQQIRRQTFVSLPSGDTSGDNFSSPVEKNFAAGLVPPAKPRQILGPIIAPAEVIAG